MSAPILRNILCFLLLPALVACGVKGDPIPYVSTHPEKPAAVPVPVAKPTPAGTTK